MPAYMMSTEEKCRTELLPRDFQLSRCHGAVCTRMFWFKVTSPVFALDHSKQFPTKEHAVMMLRIISCCLW